MNEVCSYPNCKCIVSTSTYQPTPDCPQGLPQEELCDCAAETEGKWADVHSTGCALILKERNRPFEVKNGVAVEPMSDRFPKW